MLTRSAAGSALARSLPLLGALALLALAPLVLPDFRLALLAKYLTFALAALALDLIWGYSGMLSLGHGVFFGLGAYAMAMYLKLEAAQEALPDFMSWSGLTELPWFWAPFAMPWFALLMAVLLPMLLAAPLGYLVFRSRIRGVYFSLITQALALIVSTLLIGQQPYTGGTNGLTNFSTIFGQPINTPATQRALYLASAGCLVAGYLLCRWITASRLGRLLVALRDDEQRVRFSGYDPALIKTGVFTFSAGLAGVAGALFVPQVGIISPAMLGIVPSIEMVVWVAVGGRGTLVGAILGAGLVSAARSLLSESFPDLWQYFLGALFIGAGLLIPGGLVGLARRALAWPRRQPRGRQVGAESVGSAAEPLAGG